MNILFTAINDMLLWPDFCDFLASFLFSWYSENSSLLSDNDKVACVCVTLKRIKMKRNEKRVPDFDELIFENRNKEYGAYELRKSYKTVTSFSILLGAALSALLLFILALSAPDEVKARETEGIVVILQTENLIEPEKVAQPEIKRPVHDQQQYKYVAPEVVEDSLGLSELMITDFAIDSLHDGSVTDLKEVINYDPDNTVTDPEPEIRIFVEEPPMFPGGQEELLKYVAKNLTYPQDALENNIQGRVFVKFAVWSDGSVRKIEVTKSIFPSLDQEAMRVISTLPQWTPGKQNGTAVPVWFSMPVTFQIKNN
jgi:protein TonB